MVVGVEYCFCFCDVVLGIIVCECLCDIDCIGLLVVEQFGQWYVQVLCLCVEQCGFDCVFCEMVVLEQFVCLCDWGVWVCCVYVLQQWCEVGVDVDFDVFGVFFVICEIVDGCCFVDVFDIVCVLNVDQYEGLVIYCCD